MCLLIAALLMLPSPSHGGNASFILYTLVLVPIAVISLGVFIVLVGWVVDLLRPWARRLTEVPAEQSYESAPPTQVATTDAVQAARVREDGDRPVTPPPPWIPAKIPSVSVTGAIQSLARGDSAEIDHVVDWVEKQGRSKGLEIGYGDFASSEVLVQLTSTKLGAFRNCSSTDFCERLAFALLTRLYASDQAVRKGKRVVLSFHASDASTETDTFDTDLASFSTTLIRAIKTIFHKVMALATELSTALCDNLANAFITISGVPEAILESMRSTNLLRLDVVDRNGVTSKFWYIAILNSVPPSAT
jgi:hypothetical protein